VVGVSQHVVRKRQRLLKHLDEKKAELRAGRSDSSLANVILSEKRIKTTAKYKLSEIPHPFTSREEYERSLQMPIGSQFTLPPVSSLSSPLTLCLSLSLSLSPPILICPVDEWNTEQIVRKNTKPEILLRVGRVIEPIKLPKQRKASDTKKH
jgi:U3 small nucleolar RNA-associated protein 14